MIRLIKHVYRFLNPSFQSVHLDYRVDARPRYTTKQPHQELLRLTTQDIQPYEQYLEGVLYRKHHFAGLADRLSESSFSWRNDYLPAWDTVILHSMIGIHQPSLYMEVGSGMSTLVAQQAIADYGLATSITSIDPAPRAEISRVVDEEIRSPLERLDVALFDKLRAGDILFVDNSHRLLPNSDVTTIFLDVLPRLKKGVLVHFHDIYLPYDYPQDMCDRMYSEQYALGIMLMNNPERYKIIFPSYFVSQHPSLSQMLDPIWNLDTVVDPEPHGGSFWISVQ